MIYLWKVGEFSLDIQQFLSKRGNYLCLRNRKKLFVSSSLLNFKWFTFKFFLTVKNI